MTRMTDIQDVYFEIQQLIDKKVTSSSPNFIAWKTKSLRVLKKLYGEKGIEYKTLSDRKFETTTYFNDSEEDDIEYCLNDLKTTQLEFKAYYEEEFEKELGPSSIANNVLTHVGFDMSKVFIVHGHDTEMKLEVARFIEKQSIEAIILHELPSQGKTVIEKIEAYGNVGAAIILMTPDDEGKAVSELNLSKRARQNVVFEAGYFIGKIGRNRTVIVQKGVETPSDLLGIIDLRSSDWKLELLRELKAIGYKVSI